MPNGSVKSANIAETAFLGLLARDIELHPERIKPISPLLASRIAGLTIGLNTDPDTPIEGCVAI